MNWFIDKKADQQRFLIIFFQLLYVYMYINQVQMSALATSG